MLGSTLRFITTQVERAVAATRAARRGDAGHQRAAAFLARVEGPYQELRRQLPPGWAAEATLPRG